MYYVGFIAFLFDRTEEQAVYLSEWSTGMRCRHHILALFINIYWISNVVILSAFPILIYFPFVAVSKASGNPYNYYIISFINTIKCIVLSIQLQGDKLAWFGIATALWISGLTIIVFVLGKTNDIIYGIKFSNVIIWQVDLIGVIGAGFVYVILFLWGLWAYVSRIDVCIIIDIILIFIWIIGTSFFVIFYSKRTNTFKAIRDRTLVCSKEICCSCADFDIDYLGKVNQLPLIKMIRCLEQNDSEETQRVKECLIEICNLFDDQNITYQYFILMPIISAYCEKSGFETRYEAAGTTDFFSDLLRYHWKENCRLWIQAGIILPILEKWRGAKEGIDIENILNNFPLSNRQELIIIMLLYIEYLRCCGDTGEECFLALIKMNPSRVIYDYIINETDEMTLYRFWISWNLLDHQEDYNFDVLRNFINDYRNWGNGEYAYQTWILRRILWEELRYDTISHSATI